jgi:tetratricopeptide (TPR) repeat protein
MRDGQQPRADETFSQAAWEVLREPLLTISQVTKAGKEQSGLSKRKADPDRARELMALERKLLRQIATHPALEGLGIKAPDQDRGKWIVERVSAVGERLILDAEIARSSGGLVAPDIATYLWGLALRDGQDLDGLCATARDEHLFSPREVGGEGGPTWIRSRVRGAMWRRSNYPLKKAQPGIERVFFDVLSSLQSTSDLQRWMQRVTFDYEWRRLEGFVAERQLIIILSFFAADHPVPLGLLEKAWEALPTVLRGKVHEDDDLEGLVQSLGSRELVVAGDRTVAIPTGVQRHVLEKQDSKEIERSTFQATRILKAGLPWYTHHHTAWSLWRPSIPHVEAATQRSIRSRIGTRNAAHLLDRASVFFLEAENDALRASQYSARAISVAEEDGCPDVDEYAIYLINHAKALFELQQVNKALSYMDRSLEVTKATVGEASEAFAGSLNIKGNMLKRMKRYVEAGEIFELSLSTIRKVLLTDPTPEAKSTLIEILIDYAGGLLETPSYPERTNRALELLHEADLMLDEGDYGWRQVQLNLSAALKQSGDLETAAGNLRHLACYSETAYGSWSYELYATLAALAEVLGELGHPEYDEVYLRAHQIDDRLGPYGED